MENYPDVIMTADTDWNPYLNGENEEVV